MRNANENLTLFHFFKSYDDPNIPDVKRTAIEGASVYSQTKVSVDEKGLHSGNVYTIRIPVESVKATYYKPADFLQLEDKTGAFTLVPGAKIVLGVADDENPTDTELEQKYGYDFVVSITGITDNRDGREPHWKVIGE